MGSTRFSTASRVPWACALFALLVTTGGAAGAPARAAHAWRQDRFLIGGWGVGAAPWQPWRFPLLADAGLDFVHESDHSYWFGHEIETARALDSLRVQRPGFRLKVILENLRAAPDDSAAFTMHPDALRHWGAIRRRVARGGGANRGATLGWFVWDEPCDHAAMRAATDVVRALRGNPATAGQLAMVNLLPEPVPGGPSCLDREYGAGTPGATWKAYAESYLSAFDADPLPAPCLSFDSYPFEIDGKVQPSYFENLATARDAAAAHSRPGAPVPLWVIVQLSEFKPPGTPIMRGPSLEQTRWQAWCALAFGARAISYWTVATSQDSTLDTRYGMGLLDLAGRPTWRYEPIRAFNRELHAVGQVLFPLQPVECFTGEGGDQAISPQQSLAHPERACHVVESVSPVAAAVDVLVGAFKRPGRGDDYLLVVNRSLHVTRSFRLHLDVAADSIFVFDTATGRFRLAATRRDTCDVTDLSPASARLLRVVSPLREHLPGVTKVLHRGNVFDYVLPGGVLRVDESTGARRWVTAAAGTPAADRRLTPAGVVLSRR